MSFWIAMITALLALSLLPPGGGRRLCVVEGNETLRRALRALGLEPASVSAEAASGGRVPSYCLLACGDEAPLTGSSHLASAIHDGACLLSFDGLDGDLSWLPEGYEITLGDYSSLLERVDDPSHPLFTHPNGLQDDCLLRVEPATDRACHSAGPQWHVLARATTQYWGWQDRRAAPLAVLAEAKLGEGGIILVQSPSPARKWVEQEELADNSIAARLLENLVTYAAALDEEQPVAPPAPAAPVADREGWVPIALPRYSEPGPYMDYSLGVEAPAGAHGFVSSVDGDLVCEDGTVLRLWGLEVMGLQLFSIEDKAVLDRWVDRIASLGANCVRFYPVTHTMDPAEFVAVRRRKEYGNYRPDPRRLDAFDHFFARAKQRGIYFFFVIETAAYVDDYFIPEAQEYSWRMQRRLLEHVNPYTGLRYLDDPALAVIEITNETQFRRWDAIRAMPEEVLAGFNARLKALWNRWLRERYRDLDHLRASWTDAHGQCPLAEGMDPWADSMPIDLHAYNRAHWSRWDRPYADPALSPAICNDLNVFLWELMAEYFADHERKLRDAGARCVLSRGEDISIASWLKGNELGFSGGYRGGVRANRQFEGGSMLHAANMPFRPLSVLPNLDGAPSGIYEWNDGWPNPFRAESAFVAAGYGRLQGFDLLSSHVIVPASDAFTCLPTQWFGWYHLPDPVKAFAYPLAGLMFRRGDIAQAPVTVEVFTSPTDREYTLHQERYNYAFRYLTEMVGMNVVLGEDCVYRGDAEVVINTGFSADVDLRGARRAIVLGANPAADLHDNELQIERPAHLLYPQVRFMRPTQPLALRFAGIGWDEFTVEEARIDIAVGLDSLPDGAQAFGVDEQHGACLGFLTDRHLIALAAPQLDEQYPDLDLLYRLYLDALHRWGLSAHGHELADQSLVVSQDGSLRRDWAHGILHIDTDFTQGFVGLAGELPGAQRELRYRDCTLTCDSDYAVLMLTSWEWERPIAQAEELLLTALGQVENTGQVVEVREDAGPSHLTSLWSDVMLSRTNVPCRLVDEGRAPIIFEPVSASVTLALDAAAVTVTPLDPETGLPGEAFAARRNNEAGTWTFEIGPEHRTCLYRLQVTRASGG